MPHPRKLLCIAIFLSGCAALAADPYGWEDKPSHPPLPVWHIVLPSADAIGQACKNSGWARPFACAVRMAPDVCVIYTEADPPEWIMGHEKKHCEGYDHQFPRG